MCVQNVDELKKRMLVVWYCMEHVVDHAVITSIAFHKVVATHLRCGGNFYACLYWKFYPFEQLKNFENLALKIFHCLYLVKLLRKLNNEHHPFCDTR